MNLAIARRKAVRFANTPPYRDETAKDGAPVFVG